LKEQTISALEPPMILRACFLSLLGLAAAGCSAQAPSAASPGGSDAATLPGDANAPQDGRQRAAGDGSTPATGDDSGNAAPTDGGAPFDGPDLDMQATDFECILRLGEGRRLPITNKVVTRRVDRGREPRRRRREVPRRDDHPAHSERGDR